VNCCTLPRLWTVSFISWMPKLGALSCYLTPAHSSLLQPKFELRTTLEAEHWHRNAFNLTVATWKQGWPHNRVGGARHGKQYKNQGLGQRKLNSPSPRWCNYKCNRCTNTAAHSAQQDATAMKRYSPLPSRLSSTLSGPSISAENGLFGFCKPQVGGSIPLASSTNSIF
jgi:hypothetical protein